MIRYLNCLKKKADMSPEDFRDFWNDAAFEGLVREAATLTGALRYSRNLVLHVEMENRLIHDRGMRESCDGVIEYFWDSAAGLAPLYDTPEGQELMTRMLKYQDQFIDLGESTAFFTEYD